VEQNIEDSRVAPLIYPQQGVLGMRPYPIKGQRPVIDRRNSSSGFVTGRVHICLGCGKDGGTLLRLFSQKAIRNREHTVYTHAGCRMAATRKLDDFMKEHRDVVAKAS
jgi:hypothetical protein